MTCDQIKLPFLLPTLSSLSPIPHSLLLPLTHSLSFSHPLSFPSIPRPLCFTLSLLISPSALSYMLNFSSPFYLAWKIFTFNLPLKTFYSVSEKIIPCIFCQVSKDSLFFLKAFRKFTINCRYFNDMNVLFNISKYQGMYIKGIKRIP